MPQFGPISGANRSPLQAESDINDTPYGATYAGPTPNGNPAQRGGLAQSFAQLSGNAPSKVNQDPYAQQWANSGNQNQLADRQRLMDYYNELQKQANGGSTPQQQQMLGSFVSGAQNQANLANNASGGAYAQSAARSALTQGVGVQGAQNSQSFGMQQAADKITAQNQMLGVSQQMRAQDLQAQGMTAEDAARQAELEAKSRGLNYQYQLGMSGLEGNAIQNDYQNFLEGYKRLVAKDKADSQEAQAYVQAGINAGTSAATKISDTRAKNEAFTAGMQYGQATNGGYALTPAAQQLLTQEAHRRSRQLGAVGMSEYQARQDAEKANRSLSNEGLRDLMTRKDMEHRRVDTRNPYIGDPDQQSLVAALGRSGFAGQPIAQPMPAVQGALDRVNSQRGTALDQTTDVSFQPHFTDQSAFDQHLQNAYSPAVQPTIGDTGSIPDANLGMMATEAARANDVLSDRESKQAAYQRGISDAISIQGANGGSVDTAASLQQQADAIYNNPKATRADYLRAAQIYDKALSYAPDATMAKFASDAWAKAGQAKQSNEAALLAMKLDSQSKGRALPPEQRQEANTLAYQNVRNEAQPLPAPQTLPPQTPPHITAAVPSDARTKNAMAPREARSMADAFMDKLGQSQSAFTYKGEPSGSAPRLGVMAQDVEQTMGGKPIVKIDPRTGMRMLDGGAGLSATLASIGRLNERLKKVER